MTAKRSKTPVESFGPELMAVLIKGSRERVEIKMSYRMAVKFRLRLYQLRTRMREENHELSDIMARTYCQIFWGLQAGLPPIDEVKNSRNVRVPRDVNSPCLVVIMPQDQEFAEALAAAGVVVKELSTDPVIETLEDPAKDILASYGKED